MAGQAFQVSVAVRGIVRLRWVPGMRITGSLAADAMAAVDALNDGRERPLLVQMTGVATSTREARANFGRRCSASRIALLGESAVDRVLASFRPVLGFPVPTRFFTSEALALDWLLDPP